MNRMGCFLLTVFLLVALGFLLQVQGDGVGRPLSPAERERVAKQERAERMAEQAKGPRGLAVPVAGVRRDELVDTFADARGSRTHGALDITAPRGTLVVAAAPGTVEKIFESETGGHTVYVRTHGGGWIHYYAHLDRYADGLREGMHVSRGQILGTVGSTGNANPQGPHLHFEIKRMEPGEKWYQGSGVNPYPLLGGG